jgi:tripartite-type tricarboxylate transporter receptor subunit TctC
MSSAFALAMLGPLGLFAALPAAMAQQAWPARPLRLVVGFAPGGNVVITARTLSPALSELLGQPILVENRAGAGGNVGSKLKDPLPPHPHARRRLCSEFVGRYGSG